MAANMLTRAGLRGLGGAFFGLVLGTWAFVLTNLNRDGQIGDRWPFFLSWLAVWFLLGFGFGATVGFRPIGGKTGSMASGAAYGAVVGLLFFYSVAALLSGGSVRGKSFVAISIFLGVVIGAFLGGMLGARSFRLESEPFRPTRDDHPAE